jgi:L-alanine-DL-glutamate epimerase-like enolase superfamily enzyme
MREAPAISGVRVGSYTIPTDAPEADGTMKWSSTTLVVAEVAAGGATGLGYTYAGRAAATVVRDTLAPLVEGGNAFDIPRHHAAMVRAVRNIGRSGIAACAISALDAALWDLKARLLDLPLAALLGARRDRVAIYGSGGFTSYTDARTIEQFEGWAELGCRLMKMKVGADPDRDPARMHAVREALPGIGLMIDANGALTPRRALAMAEAAAPLGVVWFEEPVTHDDTAGLAAVRLGLPAGIELAAGEYAYDHWYALRLAAAGAVDVLQLDATRCCGITGFLAAAAVADAHHLPVSAHTAPALHRPVCLAAPRLRHLEWFHDHVRIEAMLFDGAPEPSDGTIAADPSRPGNGLVFKRQDAEAYADA